MTLCTKLSFLILNLAILYSSHALGIKRYSTDLYENDICGLDPQVYSGKCKRVDKCVNLFIERKDIEVCSFGSSDAGDDTLVCCSREDFYKSRKYNKDGILDYESCANRYKHLRMTEDLMSTAFVVNGIDVDPFEFSHIAAIGKPAGTIQFP